MSVKEIADAIELVLPTTVRRPIHHHEPYINGREIANLRAVALGGIRDTRVISDLERNIAEYCGRTQALATNSGTSAIHLALLAAGIKSNEEVIVPSLTFVATANAVRYVGAIPHFVDGDLCIGAYGLQTYLMAQTIKAPGRKGRLNPSTGRVISGIIGVDLLGFPADWDGLERIAEQFGLVLIEDAAQALGARMGNRRCGSYGLASCFSFNNNKIITGNGGGMLLSNDEWLIAKAHQLAFEAKIPHPYKMDHDALAYNYNMHSLTAALVQAQFDQLDQILAAKRKLLKRYKEALDGKAQVLEASPTQVVSLQMEPNYWLTTILVEPEERDPLFEELHKRGIQARALFTPLHKLPMFADCPRDEDMQYCESTQARAVCLPSGVGLCGVL